MKQWPHSPGPHNRFELYPKLNGGFGKRKGERKHRNPFKAELFLDAPEKPAGTEALGGHTAQICNSMLQDGQPGDYGRNLPNAEPEAKPMSRGVRIGCDVVCDLELYYYLKHKNKPRRRR